MVLLWLTQLFLTPRHKLVSYNNLHAVVYRLRFLLIIICFIVAVLGKFLLFNTILDNILYFCVHEQSFLVDRI